MQTQLFRQLVWDYDLTPTDFETILAGTKKIGNLDQSWAIARVLEHTDYYTAKSLVPLTTLSQHWSKIKPKLFNRTIRDGYEFVLHHHALSPTR